MTLHVTNHAILRFQERVARVSQEEARVLLSSEAIVIAARFAGFAQCDVVLATGHRVVVCNGNVVTVKPGRMTRKRHRRPEICTDE